MRRIGLALIAGVLTAIILAACAPTGSTPQATGIKALLVSDQEANSHSWTASPDHGPVDGDSTDCTGAPYPWPKVKTVAHASQFLDSVSADSILVVVKHLDGQAAANIKAVRGALAPCAPASGAVLHGAMITALGDDSFAYQTEGKDKTGKYVLDDTVYACGNYELEAEWVSYSQSVSQAKLEDLLAPAVKRMLATGHCSP